MQCVYGTEHARGSAHFIFITHFRDNAVDCSGGYEIHNLGPVQTIPHFQQAGEVFDDALLKA